ncbi:nucleotide-binding universal stress UspA family protein [Prauserella shujinwangii]|uniref:Nucleotide-binding universal stress UspA family protein n=1 Tax=Prauserella shujinwangii TaxID=1453103 RepID=A0A2T0LQZ3_9PSEU|nr:universal stress protein [Prauserella shujinwangii]PRX45855.1 nucleotide-binding universal stress UspA family protein [Prauserella shujinwangii]
MKDVERAVYHTVAAALYSERERERERLEAEEPPRPEPERLPVVVGVDGPAAALEAARWAAREAGRLGLPLRLTHASDLPPFNPKAHTPIPPSYEEALVQSGHEWLREAADRVAAEAPGVAVDWDVRVGGTVEVLVEESAAARMLVVGSRGLGGFRRMLVGSVAVAVAAHARCPVVVVRAEEVAEQAEDIVVGVDGSSLSAAALAFAFEEAAARGARLVAVRAWRDPSADDLWAGLVLRDDIAAIEAGERRGLRREIASWREKYPAVEVDERLVHADRPAEALLDAAGNAQLIVVGSHGRGAVVGAVLGSTGQRLLHTARCPVAIVRP